MNSHALFRLKTYVDFQGLQLLWPYRALQPWQHVLSRPVYQQPDQIHISQSSRPLYRDSDAVKTLAAIIRSFYIMSL